MNHDPEPDGPTHYRIQVLGRLDESWSNWLDEMTMAYDGGVTTLSGPVADQAALRGILTRIWDLNLTLISVHRIGADDREQEEAEGP
jgi:hypothetical protein